MAKAEISLREMIETTPQGRQWLDRISQGSGSNDIDKLLEKLCGYTEDGLQIAPIYPAADSRTRILSTAARPEQSWKTLTRIDHPEPAQANAQLLHDLEHGADGAVLVLRGSCSAYGFGIDLKDQTSLETLFDKIFVEATCLQIEGMGPIEYAWWTDFCAQRKYDWSSLDVRFSTGDLGDLPDLDPCPTGLIASGSKWHDKGATAAQELGLVLSETVSLMRSLGASGINLLGVALSSTADQFETMAKFRAMRLLWSRLLQVVDITERALPIHANTSWRMMGRRDPWTNVLRATMASFAAGLGGADSICALPHTQALGLPDVFARRVARNISLILQEESHLGRLADPAAGAGVYDALTLSIAKAGWKAFQSLEARGGFTDAVASGAVDEMLADSRDKRAGMIATREIVSLGNSHFAQLNEPAIETLIERPLESSADLKRTGQWRDACVFEQLSARAKALSADTQPAILLLGLGSHKAWKARADFASDLFAAGGLATQVQALASDKSLSHLDTEKTPVICLCGSDDYYKAEAPELISRLKNAGGLHVLLAGRSDIAALDDTIFVGCNAHIVLDRVLQVLEALKR